MTEHFTSADPLGPELTTLVAWFNQTLGEADTIKVRNRLATDAAFSALADEFTLFTLARKVLSDNPRFAVEPVLNDIRAMARNRALGPVDKNYVLAVSAICRPVPKEEEEAQNFRFATDQALFETFARLAMMNVFCNDLHFADEPARHKTASEERPPSA
jgi:hypothetical protein